MDLYAAPDGVVSVAGPATAFYDLPLGADGMLVGVRLRPGAVAAVIGAPACQARDSRIPLEMFWGAAAVRSLADGMLTGATARERLAVLEQALLARLADAAPVADPAVARAVGILQVRLGCPVAGLAREVGLGERQLRRRFEAAVGLGPKRLARILRFQRLLEVIRAGRGGAGWADLALRAGYFDQSHMIRESLALAGLAPALLPAGGHGRGDTSASSNTA
jgi:AraC-like DNA-binding protein